MFLQSSGLVLGVLSGVGSRVCRTCAVVHKNPKPYKPFQPYKLTLNPWIQESRGVFFGASQGIFRLFDQTRGRV